MVANLLAIGILQAIHARGRTGDALAGDAAPDRPAATSSRSGAHVRSSRALARPAPGRRACSPRSSRAELGAGGDPALVRTSRRPGRGGGARLRGRGRRPTPERRARAASRDARARPADRRPDATIADATLPYVLATDVVDCPPGQGLPGRRDRAGRSPRRSARDGGLTRGSLPALRDAVRGAARGTRERARRRRRWRARPAAALPQLRLLTLAQARSSPDIATARGGRRLEAPRAVGGAGRRPPLGAALGDGASSRARSSVGFPARNRLLDGAVAGRRHATRSRRVVRVALRAGCRAAHPALVRPVRVLGIAADHDPIALEVDGAGHGARRGTAADRRGGRLVRVPRGDARPERQPLRASSSRGPGRG